MHPNAQDEGQYSNYGHPLGAPSKGKVSEMLPF